MDWVENKVKIFYFPPPYLTIHHADLRAIFSGTHKKSLKFATEKKVSILDKAIAANPRNVDLKLKRLSFLENISEDSDREWKNLVFQHPGDKSAWKAYIQHTMTGVSFKVHRTLKAFEKCIQTVSALRFQSFQTEDNVSTAESNLMEIFEALIQFLIESGLTERCLLLLILLLEVNVRSSSCSSVEDAGLFYESGERLLGEVKAAGWSRWHEKHAKGGWSALPEVEQEEEFIDDVDVDPDLTVADNWLTMESLRGKRDIYPWRLKQDCEDVGRKVGFDDIKGFVFFTKNVSSRLKLLEIFIQTLGSRKENILNREFLLSQPCHLTHALQSTGVLGEIAGLKLECGVSCDDSVLPRYPHHELLCTVFEQLVSDCPADVRKGVCEAAMDYFVVRAMELNRTQGKKQEIKKTGKEAKKIAKLSLKSDPLNFVIWGKLARVEFYNGKSDESLKIYHNSLSMCNRQDDALSLCASYVESYRKSNPSAVKTILTGLGDGLHFREVLQHPDSVTGAMLLRATRGLERICEDLSCLYPAVTISEKGDLSEFANALFCYSALLTLSSSTEVDKTLKQYITIIRREHSAGNQQASVDLQYTHRVRIDLISPTVERSTSYRNAVLFALDDFPDCPEFALKLCQIEVGSAISSTARKLFSRATSVSAAFFSVYFELLTHRRNAAHGDYPSTARVTNVLERAVASHSGSVLLWRLLLHFSTSKETVLTRANFACPWSKTLACDQIRLEPDSIPELVKNMQDLGLRIRTPVEEVQLLLAM